MAKSIQQKYLANIFLTNLWQTSLKIIAKKSAENFITIFHQIYLANNAAYFYHKIIANIFSHKSIAITFKNTC